MRCWSRLAIVLNNVVNFKTMVLYLTHIWRCRARRQGRTQWIAYWHKFQPAPDAQVDRQGHAYYIRPPSTVRAMRSIAMCIVGLTLAVNWSGATLLLRLHADFLLRLLLLTHPLYGVLHLLSRFLKILEPLPCECFSCIKRLLIVGERSAQEVDIAFHRLVC